MRPLTRIVAEEERVSQAALARQIAQMRVEVAQLRLDESRQMALAASPPGAPITYKVEPPSKHAGGEAMKPSPGQLDAPVMIRGIEDTSDFDRRQRFIKSGTYDFNLKSLDQEVRPLEYIPPAH